MSNAMTLAELERQIKRLRKRLPDSTKVWLKTAQGDRILQRDVSEIFVAKYQHSAEGELFETMKSAKGLGHTDRKDFNRIEEVIVIAGWN